MIASNSATILFKTPKLKFHDKGFIYKFETLNQSTLERNLISSLSSKLSRYTF